MNKKFLITLTVAALFLTACAPKTENLQGKFSAKPAAVKSLASSLTLISPPTQGKDQLLYAGQTEVLLGKFSVKAKGEDFLIKALSLEVEDSASVSSLKSLTIKYPTSLRASQVLDGSQSTSTIIAQTANFSDLKFMVPKDDDNVDFEIYGDINTHSLDGGFADSGDMIQIRFDKKSTIEALGQSSGTTISSGNGVVSSPVKTNTSYVFKNLPVITSSVASTNTAGLTYGSEVEVFSFDLAYAKTGALALRQIVLDVSSNGLDTGASGLAGTWKIVSKTDPSRVYGIGKNNREGRVYFPVSSTATAPYVGAGNFSILAPIVDDGISGFNAIALRISEDKNPLFNKTISSAYGKAVEGDLARAAFVWTDGDVSSSATSAATWHNGYKVSGLPTGYYTYRM